MQCANLEKCMICTNMSSCRTLLEVIVIFMSTLLLRWKHNYAIMHILVNLVFITKQNLYVDVIFRNKVD